MQVVFELAICFVGGALAQQSLRTWVQFSAPPTENKTKTKAKTKKTRTEQQYKLRNKASWSWAFETKPTTDF